MSIFDLFRAKQPEQTPEIIGNENEHGTGALPNSYDNRDIPAAAIIDEDHKRPKRFKTEIQFLGVEDQRSHGSCVGQVEGKQVEFFEYVEGEQVVRISKRFVYSECKKRDGYEGEGTYPRIAAKVLMDVGAAKEKNVPDNNRLPYNDYVAPNVSPETYEDARTRSVKGYAFVNALNKEELLQSIYKAGVLPASITVGNTSRLPIKPTPPRGGHRILLTGYEEVGDRVKIFFLNSWGDDWGDDGEGWLWYDEFFGILRDVMLYTDLPNDWIEEAKNKQFVFTRTLKLGDIGEDVRKLQERLNQEPGTRLAETGIGSPGEETTYFGELTRTAVRRYQCKWGIVCYGDEASTGWGQVGPQTRRALNNEPEKELFPKVKRMKEDLQEICEYAGFPIRVTDEYRTFEEQDALYAKGRTTEGPVVTNAKGGESYHNWQCAFDIAFISEGGGITYDGPWSKVGRIGEILGLEWGGRWESFEDKPHFQFTAGYTIEQFQRGEVDITKFE